VDIRRRAHGGAKIDHTPDCKAIVVTVTPPSFQTIAGISCASAAGRRR
jgi:hypothetical protein